MAPPSAGGVSRLYLRVCGTRGDRYLVTMDLRSTNLLCDCRDNTYRRADGQRWCKHIFFCLRALRLPPTTIQRLWFEKEDSNDVALPFADVYEAIAAVGTVSLSATPPSGPEKHGAIGDECPVCMEAFSAADVEGAAWWCGSSCGNMVHRACIDAVRRASSSAARCPVCRARM